MQHVQLGLDLSMISQPQPPTTTTTTTTKFSEGSRVSRTLILKGRLLHFIAFLGYNFLINSIFQCNKTKNGENPFMSQCKYTILEDCPVFRGVSDHLNLLVLKNVRIQSDGSTFFNNVSLVPGRRWSTVNLNCDIVPTHFFL